MVCGDIFWPRVVFPVELQFNWLLFVATTDVDVF